jgi:hypothetical protein
MVRDKIVPPITEAGRKIFLKAEIIPYKKYPRET